MARSYHHLFPPPPTAPFYEDDDENENEEKLNEQEKEERKRKERKIFETIQPCVGCLDKPTTIEEARQFVYCSACEKPLCQECGFFETNFQIVYILFEDLSINYYTFQLI